MVILHGETKTIKLYTKLLNQSLIKLNIPPQEAINKLDWLVLSER